MLKHIKTKNSLVSNIYLLSLLVLEVTQLCSKDELHLKVLCSDKSVSWFQTNPFVAFRGPS